jgi:hypothetical protein
MMTTVKTKTLAALVASAALAVSLAACGSSSGSDGGGRPTTAQISDSLQHGKAADLVGSISSGASIPAKVADCMASALHDSKISDGALKALVDGDEGYKGSDDDTQALSDATSQMVSCATAQ